MRPGWRAVTPGAAVGPPARPACRRVPPGPPRPACGLPASACSALRALSACLPRRLPCRLLCRAHLAAWCVVRLRGRLPPRCVGLPSSSGRCWVVGPVRSVCSQNAREACVFSAWPACRWASCRRLSSSGCGDPRIARGAASVFALVGRGAGGCRRRVSAGFCNFCSRSARSFFGTFFRVCFPRSVGV